MAKRFFRGVILTLLLIIVLGAIALAITLFFLHRTAQQEYAAAMAAIIAQGPVWERDDYFRNNQPAALQTNNALANNIRNFWREHGRYIDAYYIGFDEEEETYNVNRRLSNTFRETIIEGFARDSMSLPFTQDHFNQILEDTYFYLVTIPYDASLHYQGSYRPLPTRSYIFVNSYEPDINSPYIQYVLANMGEEVQRRLEWSERWLLESEIMLRSPSFQSPGQVAAIEDWQIDMLIYREFLMLLPEIADMSFNVVLEFLQPLTESLFVFTTLHELGHALGLGESLADLFAETALGMNHSIRGEGAMEHPYLWMFGEVGGLAYDSTFDRTLLTRLGRENRGNEFWEAAFHSEALYTELWDSVFGEYLSAEDLSIARGAYYAAIVGELTGQPALAQQFNQLSGGVSLTTAGRLLARDWHTFANDGQYDVLHRVRWLVGVFTELAYNNYLDPQPNVLDEVIVNHALRYR